MVSSEKVVRVLLGKVVTLESINTKLVMIAFQQCFSGLQNFH